MVLKESVGGDDLVQRAQRRRRAEEDRRRAAEDREVREQLGEARLPRGSME